MRVVASQVEELHRRGAEIDVFTLSSTRGGAFPLDRWVARRRAAPYQPESLTRRRLPMLTPYVHAWQTYRAWRRMERALAPLARELDQGGYDAVLVHDCPVTLAPPLLAGLQVPCVLYLHRIPHGLPPQEAPRSTRRERLKHLYYAPARHWLAARADALERRHLAAATVLAANSHFTKELVYAHYGLQAHTCYPGVDTRVFRRLPPAESSPAMRPFVLSVGRLHWMKGHELVLEAVGQIPVRLRPAVFIATPEPPDPAAAARFADLAAAMEVELEIGAIPDDGALSRRYNGALCTVTASYAEPFGLAAIESMACGTPVVAVSEGGLRETVVHGETGLLVDRRTGEMAKAIGRLAGDRAVRDRMGARAAETVCRQWTWRVAVDRLEACFEMATE